MSKAQDKFDGMKRWELIKLIRQAEKALKYLRPFRIKMVMKKCGKEGCPCKETTGHGPYSYVLYTDRQGKPRQRSLGITLTAADLDILDAAKEPQWYEFAVPVFLTRGESLEQAETRQAKSSSTEIHFLYLTPSEFYAHYGIKEENDASNMPHRLAYNRVRFQAAWDRWSENAKIAESEWAELGVGTSKGIGLLDTLCSEGYYLER